MKEIKLKVNPGMPGALRPGQQVVEWLPIEYSNDNPSIPVSTFPFEKEILLFSKMKHIFIGGFLYVDSTAIGERETGFYGWWNLELNEEVDSDDLPTHFMLLPEPPEGER